jgi:flagellar motility protein MotE (MotC chaperone)
LSELNRSVISTRLRKLPGQFVLALIDTTAILVIVAALLALIAITRVNNFAKDVVATMTEAALSKVDLPSRDVLANIQNLTAEIRTLGDTLRNLRERENPVLQSEIARLREALSTLNTSVDRFTEARTNLTEEAIGRLGQSLGETLMKMRGCTAKAGQLQPDGPSGDNALSTQRVVGQR